MTPAPFLHSPLPKDAAVTIAAGWEYEDWEIRIHGVTKHEAIDFQTEPGTSVLAAADGLAIATFGESMHRELDGEPRLFNGREVYYGSGLMVQIWHGKGRYTQYLHLDSINPEIPFYAPTENEQHDLLNAKELRASVKEYGDEVAAYRIKSGEQLGTVGHTGLGLGDRTYDSWKRGSLGYASWDKPHLHFAVCGRRSPILRNAERWDPFGIYGHADQYPNNESKWHELPNSLWTTGNKDLN